MVWVWRLVTAPPYTANRRAAVFYWLKSLTRVIKHANSVRRLTTVNILKEKAIATLKPF